MSKIFSTLPENFFSPLTFASREHCASLLMIFYNLFLEFPAGVEREVLVSAYEEHFSSLITSDINSVLEEQTEEDNSHYVKTPRGLAARFLRRLINCGWMSEETLQDYTDIVNITAYAKPFFEALRFIREGAGIEYESHVIAIYSSLCSDSVQENGQHAVLNAHYHTRLLIDSLKVLSQNIKMHLQSMFDHNAEIKDILHFHYDIYIHEIIDKAYNRLKTSDNLSRYRPRIIHSINSLLKDEPWMAKTTEQLSVIKHTSREQCKPMLINLLKEIKNDLKSIDPILEEIDDKNRRYSKFSTEKIKAKLHHDASLHNKIQKIARGLVGDTIKCEESTHNIKKIQFCGSGSLYHRKFAARSDTLIPIPKQQEDFNIELAETELMMKIQKQLNPEKISAFLDSVCPDGKAFASDIITDMESFIRVLYASLYAEGRNFPYSVKWYDDNVIVDRFKFKKHRFTVKS